MERPLCGLVLMGGGARTAYQAGVLRGIASMLGAQTPTADRFPFQILVGSSAGALNAAYLASRASQGLAALEQLARFWSTMHSGDVYDLSIPPWTRSSRWVAALRLSLAARKRGAALDTMPLVNNLHRVISLTGIDQALREGVLDTLAVTASSYTTGVHWTFCHSARDESAAAWHRPGRRAAFQPITIEHLIASSAIPFIFPATPLWVDGHVEYFGDGSMRQFSPLSPAFHLGAGKVLALGVAQPQRAAHPPPPAIPPTLGGIAGHAMSSVFQDTLQADVEQAQRVNEALRRMPRDTARHLPFRNVQVMCIQPSESLDALAQAHAHCLPDATRNALGGLGALRGRGAALASYLLFEPDYVMALLALGERDAYARKAELLAFLDPTN